MSSRFSEAIVEHVTLNWLEALDSAVLHGSHIAAGEPAAERTDPNYRDAVLEGRPRQSPIRLNPDRPPETLEGAFRQLGSRTLISPRAASPRSLMLSEARVSATQATLEDAP